MMLPADPTLLRYGEGVMRHDAFVLGRAIDGDTVCRQHVVQWQWWRIRAVGLGHIAGLVEWSWPAAGRIR